MQMHQLSPPFARIAPVQMSQMLSLSLLFAREAIGAAAAGSDDAAGIASLPHHEACLVAAASLASLVATTLET